MKNLFLLSLSFILCVPANAADKDGANIAPIQRHQKCKTEGMMGATKGGAILSCQHGEYEYAAFGMVNIGLIAGQIAKDPNGCLYIVEQEGATYQLHPAKDESGAHLCIRERG